jgi:hypothetical protein
VSDSSSLLVRHFRIECGHCHARDEPLEIDYEVDAGQRLVEIVDIEQSPSFRRVKSAEIHQVAVTASLDGRTDLRKLRQIPRHHGGGAPQEVKGDFVMRW